MFTTVRTRVVVSAISALATALALTPALRPAARPGPATPPVARPRMGSTVAATGGPHLTGAASAAAHLAQPVVGSAATPSGHGYWLVASDGGIFSFGDAPFLGSTGAIRLNQPIVGMAGTPTGHGYWFVASDGGLFSFGDAGFAGSMAGASLAPVVGMAADPSGHGYWVAARDGSVFTLGDAKPLGSAAGVLAGPAATLAASPTGAALWVAGSSGATVALPAQAAAASSGSGTSYSFLATNTDGTPIRWNPCQAVHYVTNLSGAPSTAAADVAGAFARVAAATGMTFVNDGSTDEVPTRSRQAVQANRYGSRWAPVIIAWSTPAQSDLLPGGGVAGEGGSTWVASTAGGPNVYVSGVVVVDENVTAGLASGFGSGVTMGELLLHEIGHVVGLGHTADTSQIMYPDLTSRAAAGYGAGDLTGMHRIGSGAGCLAVPAA